MIEKLWKVRTKCGNYIKSITVSVTLGEGNKIQVYSGYDEDLLEVFRDFEHSKWHPVSQETGGYWELPLTERNVYSLQYLEGWTDERYYQSTSLSDTQPTRTLYGFQKEGFNFILNRQRCMLAFEMGLGKTLITIEAIEYFILNGITSWWLIAPFGAQKSWYREMIKWHARFQFNKISTYESLHYLLKSEETPPQGIVFDESIKIKNPTAQRSQIAKECTRLIRHNWKDCAIIELSGAPAPKDPSDWWQQIECLCPGFIREGNIHRFRNRYANIEYEDHGYGEHPTVVGWKTDEVKKLGKRLSPIVMVKKKKDCLDLPQQIQEQIKCPPSEECVRIANTLVKLSSSAIEALEKLREFSDGFQYQKTNVVHDNNINMYNNKLIHTVNWIGSPKIEIIKELLDFYHTENGGPGRLVIYAPFHATIDKLIQLVSQVGWTPLKADGRGWSPPDLLEDFDNDNYPNRCLIANPGCVHGINLQRTYCLVYYSNNFSVDHRIQSQERRDRLGMDIGRGTRIVDIIHLPIDQLILEKLQAGIELQSLTLEEIVRCLKKLN